MFQLAVFREKKVDCHVFYLGEIPVMVRRNLQKNLLLLAKMSKEHEVTFAALYFTHEIRFHIDP